MNWFAVFQGEKLVRLTKATQEATDFFLGTHVESEGPADGMYKVGSLEELATVLEDRKKWRGVK